MTCGTGHSSVSQELDTGRHWAPQYQPRAGHWKALGTQCQLYQDTGHRSAGCKCNTAGASLALSAWWTGSAAGVARVACFSMWRGRHACNSRAMCSSGSAQVALSGAAACRKIDGRYADATRTLRQTHRTCTDEVEGSRSEVVLEVFDDAQSIGAGLERRFGSA